MITLNIEPYCHNCPEFEVRGERLRIESFTETEYHHILTCEHKNTCSIIKAYLKEVEKHGRG